MNRTEALGKINKALAVLTHETRAENLAGFFSKNRLIEDLLLPVFRILLKAPRLQNLNQGGRTSPYIDLADERAQLAIQVTTERSAAKVTETLTNFISNRYQKRYKRLVFFILTVSRPRFPVKTKRRWRRIYGRKLRFDPAADIITTSDLFPIIAGLAHAEVLRVHDVIAQSVIGEEHVDVESYLTNMSLRQLDYEKKSGKYIPDVFVETRETKSLARSFAHPALFFQRTLESLARINIRSWNRFLDKAGLPPLPFPELSAFVRERTFANIPTSASKLALKLRDTTAVLKKYYELSRSNPLPFRIKDDRRYFYEENTFTLQSALGWGLNREIEGLLDELAVATARVFILTGRAGQGKTNLVCDFVEKFLLKHKVPCAYLSARRLRYARGSDLGDVIQRMLFEGKTPSFAEAASLLSAHANHANKPFILAIDGLNEHHLISEFAEQLENFIGEIVRYPGLKLFLTCRSEFFHQRFGNLVKAPLAEYVFLLEANESRLEDEAHEEMVVGYFRFFGVHGDLVSSQVVETLRKDMLLLRFFCEAYGARGKPSGYHHAFIANIYREEIFEIYLRQKLGTAKAFLQHLTGEPSPTDEKADLLAVIEHCMAHMLQTWQFADVPVSIIPSTLKDALYVLLDEELILRRDAPPGPSIFSPSEETINFTFDEFRDFLLSQYLLHRVYVSNREAFQEYIARSDPRGSQSIEGLKRFLFYASRKKGNEGFWEFYKVQAWYQDVYDSEVFNIDAKLLRTEDRDLIVEALQGADAERARSFARHLAVFWNPKYWPLLNLDLLVSSVAQGDNTRFDRLILETFKTVRHFNENISASAFCKFISEHVLPRFAPSQDGHGSGLFRFLILLLPVDSGLDLNSESFSILRQLIGMHTAYAVDLLIESLSYKPTRHRPYVWRLLAGSVPLSLVEPLREEAEAERSRAEATDPVLYREVDRFLRRFNPGEAS
jgi:hypothetical protein